MYNPVSTYRVQFHKDFTLHSLEAIIPYLHQLGVRTLYASPIFESVPGSMHGYDGINPLRIDPEIGTIEELRRIAGLLRELGIGWLQDIVPNHMAFDRRNAWLMDVLRNGKDSAFAQYFDIDWNSGEKLMAPFLGDTLEKVIAQGQLKLVREGDAAFLDYSGNRYPLKSGDYPDEPTADELQAIAADQHYRLCHWQETDRHINYRRFFTVNGLICLNIQDESVFNNVHSLIAELVQDGTFSGLRIDHIDGLYDPTEYLERLRLLCGPETYIVVEKILQPGESIPKRWPISGTTGYDFLGLVNNLLTATSAEAAFSRFYAELSGDRMPPDEQAFVKKRNILERHMQGELHNLTQLAAALLPDSDASRLRRSLGALLVLCPVYRYYANRLQIPEDEALELDKLFDKALQRLPDCRKELDQLRSLFLKEPAAADEARQSDILHLYRRLMQYSGPLMAKGVEDTLMYTYGCSIVHNDVGDSPESFGIATEDFHRAMLERQQCWPLAQNTTSTHDTKRGEDARAFLNVLSHVPDQWFEAVRKWRRMNAAILEHGGPDARDEYFIYQTLFATYPLRREDIATYPERLTEYLQKALREGKRKSDWASPDENYERGVADFATKLIEPQSPFLADFKAFRNSLLDAGMLLALSQLVLKICSPGLPDIYQGTEHWDLSLVDPDNRRPVAYAIRESSLKTLTNESSWTSLWDKRSDGGVKLWLTRALLQLRDKHKQVFESGLYIPLRIEGSLAGKVVAFARRHQRRWLVVAVPVGILPADKGEWGGSRIVLPDGAPERWQHLLNGRGQKGKKELMLKDLFSELPFAVLEGSIPENSRSAGILMAISSLPGAFGIGDLGVEAKRFANQLSRAGQGIWQLLPLNPVSAGSGYSPYSSASTMAGNTMLICPESLADSGLIDRRELESFRVPETDEVHYAAAFKIKKAILDRAYESYQRGGFDVMRSQVEAFREKEKSWLEDFALYAVIKAAQNDAPWYEWPAALRNRSSVEVRELGDRQAAEIDRIVWEQALFNQQWRSLRRHCSNLGLALVGDLPFYLSYDSADVWAHQDLFTLDADGRMKGVAGVPPDYFSDTGQLWGMPTFNWDQHQSDGYAWWIARLRRNLELYDLLRIDHFRALAEYWEVPAGEDTAINGRWIEGPGAAFFDAVRESLGMLPFIAEDLGDNMEKVYELRDAVGLPGMKVMQFAFGENLPQSVDAPHNYPLNSICYTGTHDNNTTRGWFRTETTYEDRKRLSSYVNTRVTEQNVNELMARLVHGSVSQRAILPMQDVLRLDESHRMNSPSSAEGNWNWRMLRGAFDKERIRWLFALTTFYNRY